MCPRNLRISSDRLWKLLLVTAATWILAIGVTIPMDCGHYSRVFDRWGLVGFLCMPSLLVTQFGVLIAAIILFLLASHRHLRLAPTVLLIAVVVYGLSVWLIASAARGGEFGFGAVAIVF